MTTEKLNTLQEHAKDYREQSEYAAENAKHWEAQGRKGKAEGYRMLSVHLEGIAIGFERALDILKGEEND